MFCVTVRVLYTGECDEVASSVLCLAVCDSCVHPVGAHPFHFLEHGLVVLCVYHVLWGQVMKDMYGVAEWTVMVLCVCLSVVGFVGALYLVVLVASRVMYLLQEMYRNRP